MPASACARLTAAATSRASASVPTSSGAKSRVTATPKASRFPCAFSEGARVNSVACGLSTPSVPPDQTKATRFRTSSGETPRRFARVNEYESVAKPRVKSLAPPLPSVLPIRATISAGLTSPLSMRRSKAETSLGLFIGSLCTPTRKEPSQLRSDNDPSPVLSQRDRQQAPTAALVPEQLQWATSRVRLALPRGRGAGIMNGAGQGIGPVAFEEWLVVTVQTSDGARLADEDPSVEPDMNLVRPILGSFGHEADVLKFADAGFGHAIPLRSADRSRPAAAATARDVECERREHRFRQKCCLPPLQRLQGFGCAGIGDALLANGLVQRARGGQCRVHVGRIAKHAGVIAHAVLDILPDRLDGQRTVGFEDVEGASDRLVDQAALRRFRDGRLAAGGCVLGATRAKDLAGVERRPARPGHAVRSCGLANCVAPVEAGRAPGIDSEAAIHMLIVDGEFEGIASDVVFVALKELDRERVHLAQTFERLFQERSSIPKI